MINIIKVIKDTIKQIIRFFTDYEETCIYNNDCVLGNSIGQGKCPCMHYANIDNYKNYKEYDDIK